LTRVLTLFRAPEEIYLSALFQDLTNPAYPYAFGSESEVLAARPEDLRDHFFRFDWSSFPFLSLRVNSRSIAECTGYEWLERVRDDGHRAWVWNGPVTLGVAHLSALEVRSEWCRFLDAAGLGACTRTPSIPDVNRGDAKWYREQYVNTRRLVQVDPRFALLQRDARSDLPRAVVEILDRDYRREVVR
jgi:hypothetical protein